METAFVEGAGYDIPVHWTAAAEAADRGTEPGPTVAILGALGTPATFYARLADELAGRGWAAAVVEQRGLGESSLRPSRERTWDFTDVLEADLPAALGWIRKQTPDRPLLVLGHSLGGHYATMAAGRHPELLDGLVLAACGTPWIEAFESPTREMVSGLVDAIPALHEQHGYYPGTQVGFGGDDARGVMEDWRHLALTNRYRLAGDDQTPAERIAAYDGPVLVVAMADDDFAPAAAVAAVRDRFAATTPTERVLTSDDIGVTADHFGWARRPAAIVDVITSWWPGSRPADGAGGQ